ncbi:MAG TPA: hypothetical protein VGJ66_22030 [Pyrinomonadaceae bacterium]
MPHLDNILTSYINASEKSEILRVCHEGTLANLKVDNAEISFLVHQRLGVKEELSPDEMQEIG